MIRCLGAAGWTVISAMLLLGGCAPEPEAVVGADRRKGSGATPVIVERVVYEPEQVRLEAVGTSRARRSVVLHPAASGEVTRVRLAAGQRVEAGRVLLELDDRDERLAVALARVRLEEAERLFRRYQRSEGSGAVTTSDLDSARAAVEAAHIELSRAQVALDDRSLEAPFAGVVGISEVDPGARVTPDTPIATLDDRSILLVRFEVPEVLNGRLAPGDRVAVSPWTGTADEAMGRVVDLDSHIDPQSRTFLVRAEVENGDDRLRPGMSFRVRVALDGRAYPVVPEVAVQWGGEGSFVWRVAEGKAARVPVRIVQRRSGRVLVDAELAEGALVVREGIQRMREGLAVSFREPQAGEGGSP